MSSNAKKPQSVLFRTTLSLAVGTILVFLVLILVFYRQTTVSLISENERRIERQAESLALAYDSLMADASVSESAVQAFINSFARTEQVSVWFVRSDGRIEYSTSVPDFMRGDILKADNYVFLTNFSCIRELLRLPTLQTACLRIPEALPFPSRFLQRKKTST